MHLCSCLYFLAWDTAVVLDAINFVKVLMMRMMIVMIIVMMMMTMIIVMLITT